MEPNSESTQHYDDILAFRLESCDCIREPETDRSITSSPKCNEVNPGCLVLWDHPKWFRCRKSFLYGTATDPGVTLMSKLERLLELVGMNKKVGCQSLLTAFGTHSQGNWRLPI